MPLIRDQEVFCVCCILMTKFVPLWRDPSCLTVREVYKLNLEPSGEQISSQMFTAIFCFS